MDDPDRREQVLTTGGVTHVVRVGQTVRRTPRPSTATVHALLRHLRECGLDVPEPLGWDEQGREVLSFVPGDVPDNPLPPQATTDAALAALARLVRHLHDAVEGWVPPADALWGGIPGRPDVSDLPPLAPVPDIVSHQDYCPGNVVFRDGLPAALIDFDLARPTTRVLDAVNALHWWVPLTPPEDRTPSLVDADAPTRMRLFADAYGMTTEQRAQLVPTAVLRARHSPRVMRAAADVDPVFRRWWDAGLGPRLDRAAAWLAAEAPRLEAALR